MTIIAVPELRRYAPDALRMVGVPIGQADELADMVVWTQAVTGDAVRFIQQNRARLNWAPRPRARIGHRTSQMTSVDMRGGSLLEMGPRIFDFARAEFFAGRTRSIRVNDVYGMLFLPYLCARAAQSGVQMHTEFSPSRSSAPHPRGSLFLHMDWIEPDLHAFEHPAYLEAVDQGIPLTEADFEVVIALFEMLRVPTSDRSRSHAG